MPQPSLTQVLAELKTFSSNYIGQLDSSDAKQIETLNKVNNVIKLIEKLQESFTKL
jgi:hypothetical protein